MLEGPQTTTFHEINDELLNTFIREKEQQYLNSKKPRLTTSDDNNNGAMYYCLTNEDIINPLLDTARLTSTI